MESQAEVTASITVRGPQLVLDDFIPNTDTLSADLSDITAPGEYELPVLVLIPQEFHLEKLSPETIKITVRERPPAVVVDELEGGGRTESGEAGQ